jgi:polyisoprenyl-teichoic acid--peptidoglycan teichoic acid transferase
VRNKVIAATLALSAWVAGTALGSIGAVPTATALPLLSVGRAHADYAPVLDGSKPIFIFFLGSDARPGTPVDHGLCDSIHILGYNPADGRATLLGIPRDSWVPLATGGEGKINSAMPPGGPEAEIQTIENLTGITADYFALTGFRGLAHAVDEVGGVTVKVPYTFLGAERTFEEGVHTFDGHTALGFARTRHSLPGGDFDRSENQGRLLIGTLQTFQKAFKKDPSTLFTWLGAGGRWVQTSLSLDELTTLAFTGMSIKAKNVTNMVVPGASDSVGSMSIVRLSPDAPGYFEDLKADGYILRKDLPGA